MKEKNIDLGITLYDMNKQLMSKEKPLDPIEFASLIKRITKEMFNSDAKYWMLLSNERKDYTVFHLITPEGIINELKITLNNRGEILSIDEQESGAFEIWIRDSYTKECFVYYLFDYTFGMIEA